MFIRNKNKYIEIKDSIQAINLEVKFNLTLNGKSWSKIGDALYYFRDIEVDENQFTVIKDLVIKHLKSSGFYISC